MVLKPEVMVARIRRRIDDDTLETTMSDEDQTAFEQIERRQASGTALTDDQFDELEGLYETYVESLA